METCSDETSKRAGDVDVGTGDETTKLAGAVAVGTGDTAMTTTALIACAAMPSAPRATSNPETCQASI
jgi:hypothetical protein